MRLLVFLLKKIASLSMKYPWPTLGFFAVLSIAGFAAMPFIVVSTNLIAGVGQSNPVINLTKENQEFFGEQDSLIIVLEFPEPPGDNRLPFISGLGETIAKLDGVKRVRYRLLDPDDPKQVENLLRRFFLSMGTKERSEITKIFSAEGVQDALRRTKNRLFLAEDPYLQQKILEDPLEIGQFISHSMESRIGTVSLGDQFLLISAPDASLFLIQVTPNFASAEIVKAKQFVAEVRQIVPKKIAELNKQFKVVQNTKDLKWALTGKTVFQVESDEVFDRETNRLLLVSFLLVAGIFLLIYRSVISSLILLFPLIAGVGPNYGLLWLVYDEVNPVVMGATGVLLGLGAEYGVHLWGRFREEYDRSRDFEQSMLAAYEHTGPPVMLGAITGVTAFLCLCLSNQPALFQFGFFGATGIALTVIGTLFLIPAMGRLLADRKRDFFPEMKRSFSGLATAFLHRPALISVTSVVLIIVGGYFATKVSYEKDLFKVFLAKDMESMSVSQKISRKFKSNFTTPVLVTFDVDDVQTGLVLQRRANEIIQALMHKDGEITSFDSISYLMGPDSVYKDNLSVLSVIANQWPALGKTFDQRIKDLNLSDTASKAMRESFDFTGKILADPAASARESDEADTLEQSWYMAHIKGKYRFLTQVRYSNTITDPDDLRRTDAKLAAAFKDFPVHVNLSGTRQIMQAVLASLLSELLRLGMYAFILLIGIFYVIFPRPLGVGLCLIPMIGSFTISLGILALLGMGLPFSVVCVAPLVFGFSIHNAIHVVMGSLHEKGSSVTDTMLRVTPRAVLTSLTIMAGFIAMITSEHYSMEFLGWAMIFGMCSAVPLTLITLPAILHLIKRRGIAPDAADAVIPNPEKA
jgi:uncharacterized protein